MILGAKRIESLVLSQGLISDFTDKSLQNCRYYLRASIVFEPGTGKRTHLSSLTEPYILKPHGLAIVQTIESVKLPSNVMGYYDQLNQQAKIGIQLVNDSFIEPGYSGPLSCYLVNISNQPYVIEHGKAIVKIAFAEVALDGEVAVPQEIEKQDYSQALSVAASSYPSTYLDRDSIKDIVKSEVAREVRDATRTPFIIVGLLVVLATVVPFLIWTVSNALDAAGRDKSPTAETTLRSNSSVEMKQDE